MCCVSGTMIAQKSAGEYLMPPKRTLLEPQEGAKRYVRRDAKGHFTEDQVNVGKSLAADRRVHAKTIAPKGQGDHGDQKTSLTNKRRKNNSRDPA